MYTMCTYGQGYSGIERFCYTINITSNSSGKNVNIVAGETIHMNDAAEKLKSENIDNNIDVVVSCDDSRSGEVTHCQWNI